MWAEEIGKQTVCRELVALVLGAQAVEVCVIAVLQGVGCEDCGHQSPPIGTCARCLKPNGNVDGEVKGKPHYPMCEPHGALARRGISIRLQHATDALQQHERPHSLLRTSGLPEWQLPPPEERACHRDDVEVGEVAVRDLDRRCVVEQLRDRRLPHGRGLLAHGRRHLPHTRWLLPYTRWFLPPAWSGGTGAVGKKARAQGRNGLYDENLVSSGGQSVAGGGA